jgi:hypothetical protein
MMMPAELTKLDKVGMPYDTYEALIKKAECGMGLRNVRNRIYRASDNFAIMYIKDFSRFSINYDISVAEGSYSYYFPGRKPLLAEIQRGVIALVSSTFPSMVIVYEGIKSGPEYILKLRRDEAERSRQFTDFFDDLESRVQHGRRFKPEELEESIRLDLNYDCLKIDNLIPIPYLDYLLNKQVSSAFDKNELRSILLTPQTNPKNCFARIRDGLTQLKLAKFGNRFDMELRSFIQNSGYLTSFDLDEGPYERPDVLRDILKNDDSKPQKIFADEEKANFQDRINRLKYIYAYDDFVNSGQTPVDKQNRRDLIDYIKLGCEYNEKNRDYRTRLYRLFRGLFRRYFDKYWDKSAMDLTEAMKNP